MNYFFDFVSKFLVPVIGWLAVATLGIFYTAFFIALLFKLARWIDRKTTKKASPK